jgi:hypothetical protein
MWARASERPSGQVAPAGDAQVALDSYVLHQLGLPVEETFACLSSAATFDDFERWALDALGHAPDARVVARANAVVAGTPYDAGTQAWLDAVEAAPPVLSGDDLDHWHDRGYVVVHDAIPAAAVGTAEAIVWKHLGMDPDIPDSWYGTAPGNAIMVQLFRHPAFDVARTSPRVHKAFAQLWGSADLFSAVDRCRFNPPERPGWAFPGPFLHWDVALKAPIPFNTQGVLYLTDTAADQGAFSCVPGFHHRIDAWLETADERARQNPADLDPNGGTPIPGAAGDLVIWHWALPHGSRPNRARRPRIVQYVSMHLPPGRPAPVRR